MQIIGIFIVIFVGGMAIFISGMSVLGVPDDILAIAVVLSPVIPVISFVVFKILQSNHKEYPSEVLKFGEYYSEDGHPISEREFYSIPEDQRGSDTSRFVPIYGGRVISEKEEETRDRIITILFWVFLLFLAVVGIKSCSFGGL